MLKFDTCWTLESQEMFFISAPNSDTSGTQQIKLIKNYIKVHTSSVMLLGRIISIETEIKGARKVYFESKLSKNIKLIISLI